MYKYGITVLNRNIPGISSVGECRMFTVDTILKYRMRKKIRGGFNFVVFMDNKDPRIFFTKKGYKSRNLLHFLLTRWQN